MRKFLLAVVTVLTALSSYSQVQQAWVAKNHYNDNSFDYGSIVITDAAGNIYVSGCTERGATIDESQDGMMTIKYDKNGDKLWAVRFKGHNLKGAGIAVDEMRENLQPGSVIRLGALYRPGVYYIRVQQGKEHKELKMIKLSN